MKTLMGVKGLMSTLALMLMMDNMPRTLNYKIYATTYYTWLIAYMKHLPIGGKLMASRDIA